jgi:PAS domain S-box-containing protein
MTPDPDRTAESVPPDVLTEAQRMQLLDTVLTHINDYAYVFDREGRFLYVNRPLLELWGLTLEQAIGRNFFDLGYPTELAAKHQQEIQQVITLRQSLRGESLYTSPRGVAGRYEYIFNPVLNGNGEVDVVIGSTRDITARVRADEALRESEERFRFLDTLGEATRGAANPVEVMALATRLLGEHLRVSRCDYADVEADGNRFTVRDDWCMPGLPSIAGGTFQLSAFGRRSTEELQAGRVLVLRNIDAELPAEDAATFHQIDTRAVVCWPLVKEGRLRALMAVNHASPRDWTTAEVALVREVCERSWAHIERVRTEAARREAQTRYLELINAIEQGFCTLEVAFDEHQQPVDYRFLEVSPSFEAQTGIPNAAGRWMREIAPDQDQHWFNLYGRVALTGESVRFEQHSTPLNRWWSVFAFRTGDPSLRRVAVLFHDISDRKRAEQALRASEERAQAIIDSIADGFITLDHEWRLTYVNRRGEEILRPQYGTKEDMLGKTQWELFPATRGTILEEKYHRAMRDRVPVAFELFYPPLQSWFDIRAYPSREGLSLYFLDITDRKRAEEALRESEERFRHLAEAMPQIVWTAQPDGSVDYLNEKWYDYTGQPADTTVEATWVQVVEPDARERIQAAWSHAVRTGETYEIEFPLRRADGMPRWHLSRGLPVRDAAGRIVKWVGTNTDIHDQKRATEMLAEATTLAQRNAAVLEALIEAMPHGVYFGHAGGITRCNQHALRLLGAASLDDLRARIGELGERFRVCYRNEPERLVDAEELPFARALRGESASLDTWITKVDGSGRVCIRGTAAPVIEGGQIIGAVAVNTDITEQVRNEEAIKEARDAAETANRAKDRFLAVLSHELRTPLTPITMAVEMLAVDRDLPPTVREHLAMIRRNVQLEVKLIDDLLDLSRVASGKVRLQLERLDFAKLVHDACDSVLPLLHARGVRFRRDVPDRCGTVEGDPGRLQQVLWNLLSNSAKFTSAGREVEVIARLEPNDRVSVTVRDQGVGITADLLPKVFDAFEQGDPQMTGESGGLGLGLAIAKTLTELQGGTITADSAGPGKGATFTVTLPAAPQPPAPPDARPLASAQTPDDAQPRSAPDATSGWRVLVVEDHADTAQMLARALEKNGFRVRRAATVAAALALASVERFDVLLSDIGLPDASGYELIQALQTGAESRNRGIRGIAMSGYGMDEDLRRSREAGFVHHLVKPVNLKKLIAVLRQVAPPN